jgi:hypothetical protein
MPMRPRRRRRAQTELTLSRYMDLTIGPGEHHEPVDLLEAVYREHHRRFGSTSWGTQMFVQGIDTRAPLEMVAAGDCPGLPT